MAKVLGFGGVFLKVSDPKAYCQWYKDALGVDITDWGTMMWESVFGWFIDPEGIKIELWQEPPTTESANTGD